ncbi:MAG TPA: MFS transporter [Lacipirellulaceae bacterium]|jgi:NNP family nitrate/nitrite transporter-like MFS transporter|nr:MFS transporter [Lacipirellulaceae bacterium]
MQSDGKAPRIDLLSLVTPNMRAFHMSWIAFFLCFFAWFGIAPLMSVVRAELSLTKDQVGWCIIGSVAVTIFARLFVGWLCDRVGPRLTYTWLLLLGSVPVMCIGLAHDFKSFLLFRVLIGAIGAAFVVTQYHTSRMFSANCVGTANATAAGWGNLGGGVTQLIMPLVFALFVGTFGLTAAISWRLAMVAVGMLCAATGIAYYFFTQDTPEGNYRELRATGKMPTARAANGAFWEACCDRRVWALFLIYGACFGVELTIDNIAVLYYLDYFPYFKQLDPAVALKTAGMIAAMFGGMNLFARTIGGWIADKCGNCWGLDGRVKWLFIALFGEGIGLMLFAQATTLSLAIPLMITFAMFVKMSNGATYAVVPFINRRALGAVSGIVGAGGNVGAVALGFLFKTSAIDWHTALFIAGMAVTCVSFASFLISFRAEAARETAFGEASFDRPSTPGMVPAR